MTQDFPKTKCLSRLLHAQKNKWLLFLKNLYEKQRQHVSRFFQSQNCSFWRTCFSKVRESITGGLFVSNLPYIGVWFKVEFKLGQRFLNFNGSLFRNWQIPISIWILLMQIARGEHSGMCLQSLAAVSHALSLYLLEIWSYDKFTKIFTGSVTHCYIYDNQNYNTYGMREFLNIKGISPRQNIYAKLKRMVPVSFAFLAQ